jgi:hypothetical protein
MLLVLAAAVAIATYNLKVSPEQQAAWVVHLLTKLIALLKIKAKLRVKSLRLFPVKIEGFYFELAAELTGSSQGRGQTQRIACAASRPGVKVSWESLTVVTSWDNLMHIQRFFMGVLGLVRKPMSNADGDGDSANNNNNSNSSSSSNSESNRDNSCSNNNCNSNSNSDDNSNNNSTQDGDAADVIRYASICDRVVFDLIIKDLNVDCVGLRFSDVLDPPDNDKEEQQLLLLLLLVLLLLRLLREG